MAFALLHRRPTTRRDAPPSPGLEGALASLSADELVAAIGLAEASAPARAVAAAAFAAVSAPLGRALARFDDRIETLGPTAAAAAMLTDLGARWTRLGQRPPGRGPLLVVANHPGAYDALVVLAALERDDVAIVAADRRLLRAMPALQRHLVFVPEAPSGTAMGRAAGLRRALAHLAGGGALVHFGAGRIEPDPAFALPRAERLAPWQSGTGTLVRAAAASSGALVAAIVAGVHSPRAKRLFLTRAAERRGLTTLAPLLQVALRRYRDVEAVVRFGDAIAARELTGGADAMVAARVRDAALALWPPSPRVREQVAERCDRVGPRG
jgi:1-acyl-sn-glycerol-3-phosphate acyltransferase